MQLLVEGKSLVLLIVLMLLMTTSWAKAPDKNDVRVLIDISGSMRQNDPDNLRRPALRMLAGLMQPGTRAGVWTFAKWTNRLVPVSEVDEVWKKNALKKSEQIASPGQFTHVERVIEDAMKDWEGKPDSHNRHLVLLTDGMVDVSRKPGESEASRQRILKDLLPRLKALDARVHTVALSARADHELMKQLSAESDGWYQQVDSAENLQRVFLKIFEQVGKPEAVPLKGNRFTVDSSIREATLLIFNKPDSLPAALISPDGVKYVDSDLPAGVAWYRDEGYELITVSTPQKGEWSVQADLDPDNRVMIVTDLKLETSELPTYLAVGEKIPMAANLSNRGKTVTRKAFLRVLDVRADKVTPAGSELLGLNDRGEEGDTEASDGIYGMKYAEMEAFDDVELLFSVESPTFMREKRYRIAVHEPATLVVEGADAEALAIVSVNESVMLDGSRVSVWQDDASGGMQELALNAEGNAYVLHDPLAAVYASIEGKTRLGNIIQREYGPVYVDGVKAPVTETKPETEPLTTEAEVTEVDESSLDDGGEGMLAIYLFTGANLAVVLIGLLTWLIMRKRRKSAKDDSLLDDFETVDESGMGENPLSEETS